MMNLFLCSVLTLGWLAPVQPPAKADPVPQVMLDFYTAVQPESKLPSTLEQALAAALANHPDMRLVEAELRVAEAKVAQARIAVSQKVTEDFHRLQKERSDVDVAQANFDHKSQLHKKNFVSQSEMKEAQHQLAQAKSRLAATESSWKLIMGKQQTGRHPDYPIYLEYFQAVPDNNSTTVDPTLKYQYKVIPSSKAPGNTSKTSTNEELKAHLATMVKLEKQTALSLEAAFQKVTVGAGMKVRVKLPVTENKNLYREVTQIDLEANEFPVHTWLQLILDDMNNFQVLAAPQRKELPKRYDLYVREYGLLLTSRDLAPPDAITVQELWKQTQYEKAVKEVKQANESAPKK